MSVCLVVHDLAGVPAAAEKAIFEIAPDHWQVTPDAVLVGAGISPAYLRDHLLRALADKGATPGLLLVTRVPADMAWNALPAEGEAWLRDALD